MSQRDRESAPTVRGVPTPRGDAPARASAEAAPGRFEHVREIARGGMGRVVEVFDRQLGRTVALKQSLDAHPESRLRFEREVAITARLEHPSIVPVYDAGVGDDGEPYYVMRRVSGKPLDQLVDEAGTLDQRLLLLPNMLAVADAIAHAHQRDVIHRDLKPSNVLIGELGETVVIDWGLAKLVGEADVDAPAATARAIGDSGGALKTTMGTVIGTPGFMAPEQVSADATDARSDVYALGASLFHVLAGRPPFEGSEEAVLAHTLAGEVPRLAALVPGVPPELVTIIDTAMARSPDARYANAGGFSDDLRRFLGGQLVASHHYGRRDRFVRWLRRHRAVVAAVAIGAALAIGVAVVSLRRVLDAQERTEAALAGERARADDLVIAEATAYLETDPTRAIALLEELPAASPRWATLGPIVADARVRGVAVAYPTHGVDSFVERAPGDGPPLVLTSGDDSVRIHDLSRRTTTVVASGLSHSMRAHWLGRLVAITGRSGTVQLFDPNTSARAEIVASAAIRAVDTAPGVLAYVDDHDVAFTQDIAALPLTGSAHVVDRALPARSVMLSPSGRLLVIEGEHAMQLFRRAGDGWTLVGAADVEMLAATFDAGETRLATVDNTPDRHGVVELDTTTGTIVRRWTAPIIFELAYAGTALYEVSADPMQIERLGDGGARVRDVDLRLTHGMSLARVGTFVAALESPRRILVGLPGTRAVIHPPLDVLGIAGDPGGRYLFGMCGSKLLVWDLTYMVPALADTPAADEVGFVDPDTLVVSELRKDMDRDLAVYHLASGSFALARRELLGRIETLDGILTGPGGMLAVLDRRRGDIHVLRPQLHLPHLSAPIFTLAVAGGWVAAILRDGNVYRRSPHGAQVQVPEESVGSPTIDAAGVMSFASERDLYRWPTDAPPAVLAHFDVDIAFVHLTVGGRLAVVTVDGTLYVVDPGTREVRTVFRSSSSARGSVPFTFSDDGAIAATQLDDGIGIVDLRSGERWTIATGTPYHALAMSPDGRFVVAVEQPLDRHGNLLYRFPIDVPTPSPGSLAELTNARAPARPRGELDWRDSAP